MPAACAASTAWATFAQRAAGQVLHRDEVLALVLADLEDRDDAGVAERRARLGLVAKPRARGLVVQELQRDVALERGIVGSWARNTSPMPPCPRGRVTL